MNPSLPPDDDQTGRTPAALNSTAKRCVMTKPRTTLRATRTGNAAAETADDDTATRQRGPHGRRRRGRGGRSEGERPAPLNGQAQAPAIPSAPLGASGR